MARILVIDDDADFLQMIRILLEQSGHQAVLSPDGVDGLAKASSTSPDLAIVDVMMPEVNGYEICRRLRGDPATASIPILILTARGQPVDRQAALDAGADDYMAKPVTVTGLRECINKLLAKPKRVRQPAFKGLAALLSLRGGVGVTTLAVNLAAALAQAPESDSVCLVDLCSSSGHVALQLGLRPDPDWSSIAKAGDLTPAAIETHLLQHDCGLHVLASPIFPVVGQGLSRTVSEMILDALQQRFSIVVVDMPSTLNEAALAALEVATTVGLVVTAEAPSIQSTVGTLHVLNRWATKFHVIINQVTPGQQPPLAALERALKRPALTSIPFDPAQAQALARGIPLVLQRPPSSLAQAVRGLAQALASGHLQG